MCLGRESVEDHFFLHQSQRHEELFGLTDRTPQVVFAVHDEDGDVDVARECARRHPGVFVGVAHRIGAVFDAEHGADVTRPLFGEQVVDRPLGADRAQSSGMASGQQRRHVSAVTAALHTHSTAVAERVTIKCGVENVQNVLQIDSTPAGAGSLRMLGAHDRLTPGFFATRRSAWIARHHDETGRGLSLELVEVGLAVLRVRTTVDVEDHRVLLVRVEVARAHDPGVDHRVDGRSDVTGLALHRNREPFPVDRLHARHDLGRDVRENRFVSVSPQVDLGRSGGTRDRGGSDARTMIEGLHAERSGGDCGGRRGSTRVDAHEVALTAIFGGGQNRHVVDPDRRDVADGRLEGAVEAGRHPCVCRGGQIEHSNPNVLRVDARVVVTEESDSLAVGARAGRRVHAGAIGEWSDRPIEWNKV